jgi:hypothetical protein
MMRFERHSLSVVCSTLQGLSASHFNERATIMGSRPPLHWLGLAGIISPALLTATTLVVAAGRPEYSHARQTLSELGAVGQEGAVWMNLAGIIPAGVLVAAASLPLFRSLGNGLLARAGAIVLAIAGLSLAGTAVVPLAGGPGHGTPQQSVTHLALAIAGLFGLAMAPLLFALHAHRHRPVRVWFWPSLVAGLVTFLCAVSIAWTAEPGLYQRAAFAAFYVWLIAVSVWVLLRRSAHETPAIRPAQVRSP